MKNRRRSFISKKLWVLSLVLILVGASALTVYAGLTAIVNGPFWSGGDYTFEVDVTAISNPDKLICIEYDIGQTSTTTVVPCSCTLPECDPDTSIGLWICAIPGPILNQTTDYDIAGWTAGGGGNCGSEKTAIPGGSGSLTTSPTAIALQQNSVAPAKQGILFSSLTVLLLGILSLWALTRERAENMSA